MLKILLYSNKWCSGSHSVILQLLNMKDQIQLSPIKEMEIRSSKIPGVVSLAQGIPSFNTPECIKKKAIEAIENNRTARYSLSPGLLEFREAIEYSLSKQNIFYDFEKEIIVTAGSIEAITATFLAILEPGDEVLIPDPTYTSYQSAIKTARGVSVFVPLKEKNDWALDIEEIKKRITKRTKAILFCNPNNPTGTIYNRDQLMEIAELAERYGFYILSDEVYKDFIYNDEEFYTLAQFPAFRKRLIYIFSFSKAYAMTGWRVAYLATDEGLAEKILGAHDAMVTCAPVVSQWAGLAALEMADDDIQFFYQEFEKRKKIICERLDDLDEWFSYSKPNSAYFAFPKFTEKLLRKFEKYEKEKGNLKDKNLKDFQKESLSWRFSLELLYAGKVAVVPGFAFGPTGENHIRLCFGREEENIRKSMDRIEKFVENL